MYRIKKIPSDEAGDFDGKQRNICTFTIPGDGIVDMTQSYIVFETEIKTQNEGEVQGIYNTSLTHPAESLIRNASFKTARAGNLEDVKHVNVLQSNLVQLTSTRNALQSQSLFNGMAFTNEYGLSTSSFRDLKTDGASVERTPELLVPCGNVFNGVGSLSQLPLQQTGKAELRLELFNGDVLSNNRSPDVACGDVSGNSNTLVITQTMSDNRQSGLWVGERINVTRTDAGGEALPTVTCMIQAITAPVDGVVSVQVSETLATCEQVVIKPIEDVVLSYNIKKASLVLYYVQVGQQSAQKVQRAFRRGVDMIYRSWHLELDTMDNTSQFNKNYYIEPNCSSAIVLMTDANAISSEVEHSSSYRCSINGVDTTNTEVGFGTPLHKDVLMTSFARMVKPVESLQNVPFIISTSIPPVNKGEHQFQLVLNGDAAMGAKSVHLYKLVEKTLSIKGNSVSVK